MQNVRPFWSSLFRRKAASRWHTTLAAMLGMTMGTAWVAILFWNTWVTPGILRYADSNLPMLSTPDAFFYLCNTKEMLRVGISFESVNSLSAVLTMIQQFIWLPSEITGFWLPTVFALACGLCFALWGRLFRLSPLLIGVAALAGSLLPAWTARVQPGSLDTDAGIFLLWGLCLWLAARLTLPHRICTLWKGGGYALAFMTCASLLGWFWLPGLLLVPTSLWLWGLTWSWSRSPREKRIRMTTAFLIPLAGLLFLFASESMLPVALRELRNFLLTRMEVVLNPQNEVIFQSLVGSAGVNFSSFLLGLGGSSAGGWLALFAILCMGLRHPRETLLLAPSLFMTLLAFLSNHFLLFSMLPVGLAVAMLPLTLPALLRRCFMRRLSRNGLLRPLPLAVRWKNRLVRPAVLKHLSGRVLIRLAACCLLGLALWSEGRYQMQNRGGLFLTRAEDQVGLALRDAVNAKPFGEAKALFHWWDEGHYLRYRTGLQPFFDGNTQNPLSAFLAAVPFVTDNANLSRRWIRYFALHNASHGREGWDPLVRAWGSAEVALRELVALFSLPEEAIDEQLKSWPELPGLAGVYDKINAKDWLFPRGAVFVYLPVRFLTLSPWWMSMGSGLQPGPVLQHMERFPTVGIVYDPQSNQISLPDDIVNKGYTKAGGPFLATHTQPFVAPWGADREEPLLVVGQHSPWGYLANKVLARSIGFRLLAPSWEELPGFRLIAANFGAAGAWEVLP